MDEVIQNADQSILSEIVAPIDPADLCPRCQKAKASTRKTRLCGTCHKKNPTTAAKGLLTPDLVARAAIAKTTEDWQRLAADLAPVMTSILNGEARATAAQASLIKDIMNRAFGKPVATQVEKRISAGVIVLPALDSGAKLMICPKCGYNATANLVAAESRSANSVPVVNS